MSRASPAGTDGCMPRYPDEFNPALLDRIPLDAAVVLDVGCATGALGAALKRRNPKARVLGIERDAAAAAVARTRLDAVVIADVEADPFPFDGATMDCIVYGDCLEHLVDPWALLVRHARHLSPTGSVLICIPNVEHWSFVDRLLRGTFAYEQQGLFDRTHLRWFTLGATRQALQDAGLTPHDVVPRIFDLQDATRFADRLAPSLAALGVDRADYVRRAAPLQFVWRAGKSAPPRLTVVCTELAPVGGVSHVRVTAPLAALATDPAVTTILADGFDPASLPEDAPKIYIFHRPAFDGVAGLAPVRRLLALGYIVVCEFDDHPDHIPAVRGMDLQNFAGVHAVQTATEPLAALLRQRNPEVAVFPNAVTHLPDPRERADGQPLSVFFGALNREEDWRPHLHALNAVARDVGGRLAFQVVNDRALFDALETPHKRFTPLCGYPLYMDILTRTDVSFMPLLDTPFNRCKSDLKFIEASAMGVASLASRPVYGEVIQDGITGLLFDDPAELKAHLLDLTLDRERARTLARAARAYVADHRMMAYQMRRRIDWYRSLWDRRAELNAALRARVPALGA